MEYTDVLEVIPKLEEDEVYISHVGDGEYEFNVFGSVHKDLEKFVEQLVPRMMRSSTRLLAKSFRNGKGFRVYEEYVYEGKKYLAEIARLTIEKIDPEKAPIGYEMEC